MAPFLLSMRGSSPATGFAPGFQCSPSLPLFSNGSNVGCIPPNITIPTSINTTGWVNNPSGRGTIGIVWNCTFTLFACVWTALHLNMPKEKEPWHRMMLRRLKWVTIFMIAPEYTFWVARGQRRVARNALSALPKFFREHWTPAHTFYAAMGGLVIEIEELPESPERDVIVDEVKGEGNDDKDGSHVKGWVEDGNVASTNENEEADEDSDSNEVQGIDEYNDGASEGTEDNSDNCDGERARGKRVDHERVGNEGIGHEEGCSDVENMDDGEGEIEAQGIDKEGMDEGAIDEGASTGEIRDNEASEPRVEAVGGLPELYTGDEIKPHDATEDQLNRSIPVSNSDNLYYSDNDSYSDSFFFEKTPCFRISVEELTLLFEAKLISFESQKVLASTSKDDLQDRSKADFLGKSIACIQFLWLGLQCAARRAQHLPLAPLELVTIAEALVTIFTYIMWWDKPKDATSTIRIVITGPRESVEAILLESAKKAQNNHHLLWGHSIMSDESGVSQILSGRNPKKFRIRDGFRTDTLWNQKGLGIQSSQVSEPVQDHGPQAAILAASETVGGGLYNHETCTSRTGSEPGPSSLQPAEALEMTVIKSSAASRRNSMEVEVSSSVPPSQNQAVEIESLSTNNSAVNDPVPKMSAKKGIFGIFDISGDWTGDVDSVESFSTVGALERNLRAIKEGTPYLGAVFIAMMFGAFHSLAWDYTFPTTIERDTWRVASLIMALGMPIFFILAYPKETLNITLMSPSETARGRIRTAYVIGIVYSAARLYVVVESLISLRKQPAALYEDVNWLIYFPHFQ